MTLPITSELLELLDGPLDTIEKVEIAWHLTSARSPMPVPELQARARPRDVMADRFADERVRWIRPKWSWDDRAIDLP